jgi:hypothetical protein
MARRVFLNERELALAKVGLAMLAANVKSNASYDLATWTYIMDTAGYDSSMATPIRGVTVEEAEAAVKALHETQLAAVDAEQACLKLVMTVHNTGGVKKSEEDGFVVPVNDEDWLDLGMAYEQACEAVGMPVHPGAREEAEDKEGAGDADHGS